MHRRDSERTGSKLLLLAAAVGLSGCAGFTPPSTAGYPKFTDIPQRAAPTTPASETDAEVASLKAAASKLAEQPMGNPNQQADDAQIAAARAVAAKAKAPTDADAAATAAFLRQARARATPPPPRNK